MVITVRLNFQKLFEAVDLEQARAEHHIDNSCMDAPDQDAALHASSTSEPHGDKSDYADVDDDDSGKCDDAGYERFVDHERGSHLSPHRSIFVFKYGKANPPGRLFREVQR